MDHIAIDLHKRSSLVREVLADASVKEYPLPTARREFEQAFGHRPPARVLLESGTESEWVACLLEELGHTVIVADPNYPAMYSSRGKGRKSNKADVKALAQALLDGRYRPAHRLSRPQRQVRQQLLIRTAQVRSRTRLISLVRSMLRQEGLGICSCSAERFVRQVRAMALPKDLAQRLEGALLVLDQLTEQVAVADAALEELAGSQERVCRLMSHPRIGALTGLAFVSVIDDPHRFGSASAVRCYLGLVPREDSSGDYIHRGRITKCGNSMLRWLLVEAGWGLLRSKDPAAGELRRWGLKIAAKSGKSKAAVALARKVAGTLWAMDRDQRTFQTTGDKGG